MLEDHAALADGLLALYEATFDEHWFVAARSLLDTALARFADPAGGFFDTADDHERLFARPKDVQDNATPSGSALVALELLRLAAWTGEGRYRTAAERAIATITPFVVRHPTAFAMWLQAIDIALADVAEVAVIGQRSDPATQSLVDVAAGYAPHRVLALASPGEASTIELLTDRPTLGGATAYVCRGFACRAPVTDPEALREQLADAGAAL